MKSGYSNIGFGLLILINCTITYADSVIVDSIYHPYVNPLEREIEWRSIYQDHQDGRDNSLQKHKFSYGMSLNDRWFLEGYLHTSQSEHSSMKIDAYELESLWQITEQGEYWADWGMSIELEKMANVNAWEVASGLLVEKEMGKFSYTANGFLMVEWGEGIKDEIETRFNLQARYRWSIFLEPAVEFYSGENTRAFGPAFLGSVSFGSGRKWNWEAGCLFGLENKSPDQSFRFKLEYEF